MMAPTRPIYTVAVVNVDQGWSIETTHKEGPPAVFDHVMIDGLSMGWAIDGGQAPGQLSPDSVSFGIYFPTAEHMLAMDIGDIITVDLDRPTAAGLIPYMHFNGRITDLDADSTPAKGVEARIVATDLTSDAYTDTPSSVGPGNGGRPENIAGLLFGAENRYRFAARSPVRFTQYAGTVPDQSFGEALRALTAGGGGPLYLGDPAIGVPVLRGTVGWEPGAGWNTSGPAGAPVFYYHEWNPTTPAPAALAISSTDGDRVTLQLDPRLTEIDAATVTLPATWRKDRKDLINEITMNGWQTDDPPADPGNPQDLIYTAISYTVSDPASIARYGRLARTIDTLSPYLETAIKPYDNNLADPLAWSVPSIIVAPKTMDDAALDDIASVFYPHQQPTESPLGRVIRISNVPPKAGINGPTIFTQIIGCDFRIERGELLITPSLRAIVEPPYNPISWDDLAAGPYAATAWQDAGGFYIDPALHWNNFEYTED